MKWKKENENFAELNSACHCDFSLYFDFLRLHTDNKKRKISTRWNECKFLNLVWEGLKALRGLEIRLKLKGGVSEAKSTRVRQLLIFDWFRFDSACMRKMKFSRFLLCFSIRFEWVLSHSPLTTLAHVPWFFIPGSVYTLKNTHTKTIDTISKGSRFCQFFSRLLSDSFYTQLSFRLFFSLFTVITTFLYVGLCNSRKKGKKNVKRLEICWWSSLMRMS